MHNIIGLIVSIALMLIITYCSSVVLVNSIFFKTDIQQGNKCFDASV